MTKRLKRPVELIPGRRGQFEVWVGDRQVAVRKGGLLAMLLRRPWPSHESIVDRVSRALELERHGSELS